jgi:hypothetical protein
MAGDLLDYIKVDSKDYDPVERQSFIHGYSTQAIQMGRPASYVHPSRINVFNPSMSQGALDGLTNLTRLAARIAPSNFRFIGKEEYERRAEETGITVPYREGMTGTEMEILASRRRIDEKVQFAMYNGGSKATALVGFALGSMGTDPTTAMSVAVGGGALGIAYRTSKALGGLHAGATALLAAEATAVGEAAITHLQGSLVREDPNAEFDEGQAQMFNIGLGLGLEVAIGAVAKGLRHVADRKAGDVSEAMASMTKVQDAANGPDAKLPTKTLEKVGVDPLSARYIRENNVYGMFPHTEAELAEGAAEIVRIVNSNKLMAESRKHARQSKVKRKDIIPDPYKSELDKLKSADPAVARAADVLDQVDGPDTPIRYEGMDLDVGGGLNVTLYKAGKSDSELSRLADIIEHASGVKLGDAHAHRFRAALKKAADDHVEHIEGQIKIQREMGRIPSPEMTSFGTVRQRPAVVTRAYFSAADRILREIDDLRADIGAEAISSPSPRIGGVEAPTIKEGTVEFFDPDITAAGHTSVADKAVFEQVERAKSMKGITDEQVSAIQSDLTLARQAADQAGKGCARV